MTTVGWALGFRSAVFFPFHFCVCQSPKKKLKRITMVKFIVVLFFFLLTFLWTFTRGDDSVSCDLKKNCTLPCHFQPGDEVVVHWIIENIPVHSYYYNRDQLGNQDQHFRSRTSLFKDKISSGNASLLLTGVMIQDEGRYKCYTSTIRGNQELFVRLNVDVPVQKVFIEQSEKGITCMSEGIYPKPELTWSTEPPTSLVKKSETIVQQDGQLYNISSSLIHSDNDDNFNNSCTVSTRKYTRTATLFKRSSISGPESERTISCTDSKTPLPGFIWKFNYNEVIVTQSEAGGPYTASEKWKRHVRKVSESGSLTLQGLSSYQNGVYTCEVTNADGTLITNTCLKITEESSQTTAIVIGVLVALVVAAGVVAVMVLSCRKCKKKLPESKSQNEGEMEDLNQDN